MEEAWREPVSVSQNQCHHNLICPMEEFKMEVGALQLSTIYEEGLQGGNLSLLESKFC